MALFGSGPSPHAGTLDTHPSRQVSRLPQTMLVHQGQTSNHPYQAGSQIMLACLGQHTVPTDIGDAPPVRHLDKDF